MVRQSWSDEDLAQRLQQRDPEALEMLISRYSQELFCFIRLVLNGVGAAQDTEECVNDLFVAVWQEIESFDPERGTLRTWLTMRAKYIALDRRRQLYRRQAHNLQPSDENQQWVTWDGSGDYNALTGKGGEHELPVTRLPHYDTSMENLLEENERREELLLALATLPELDRYLIYQRYFKYASIEELAAKTGLTRHAIDTRLWRARKSLRGVLEEARA